MGIKIIIGGNNSYLNSVVALAYKVYKEEDVSSVETYREYFKACPEAFVFAVNDVTEELIGYSINLPLDSAYFEKTTKGNYDESDLDPAKVRDFKIGTNHIYLFSIVIDPEYENRVVALMKLSRAMKEQFINFAKMGIYITQASAIALSESGAKICEGMNMNLIGYNRKGTVYWNKEFQKVWIDENTKNYILKTFVKNRKMAEAKGE